ncbi:MAG: hypothetical protein ACYDCH_11350 [Gaiellaceae bacterium]
MRRFALLAAALIAVGAGVFAPTLRASGSPSDSASLLAARFGPGPIEGPTLTTGTDGKLYVVGPNGLLTPAAFCAKTIVVNFIVYGTMTAPVSNGCWAFNRIPQNATIGGTFTICHGNGTKDGNGPNKVFDDTNPGNPLSPESSDISGCGSTIYAEYMARRTQSSENWCSNHGFGSICWRENTGGVSITRYFAELYSQSETSALEYASFWPGDGSSEDDPFAVEVRRRSLSATRPGR